MADIIRLFEANETTFDHYENVLTDVLSFESEEEENGIFYCEMTCPLDDRIQEGKIIKAPTARGEQLFRIVKVNKNVPAMTLYVYGRHIFYDLLDNFLLNIRPTDKTLNNALADILSGTEYVHPFTATSDVPGLNTANYVRMNPVAAIMGSQNNSALNLWGGFLKRNNFTIQVLATSPDKGYEVRFGKNLLGADEELDMTEVVTRFYPTVVIEEPTVTVLPEKYVDSPLINNYPYPIIREYRIELTDDEKLLPIASIYQLMRDRCNAQFALKADLPKVNYKIDFVELRKTEQYKDFAVLEELDLSDTVWVYVDPLNLNMSARMIKYRHDGIHDRFLSMELGNFKPKLTNQKTEFKALIESATKELTDGTITTMLKDAVDRIQGNLGGNVVTITNDGKPVAMAFMDTDDVNTANEYVIINNQGIAFGVNGLNNPPQVAIDISGNVVATSGFFNSITTNLIQSDIGSDLVLTSNIAITGLVADVSALDGRLDSAELKITPSAITSTVTSSSTYTTDLAGKEQTIIKQSTAPTHLSGKLWLDTSVTPNVLKRSTGSAWVKVTPTTAAEVGAYSSTDGGALAGRVTTAEQKITPTAITQTVENNTTTLATKALVTQTASDWTATFSQIGGRNLIKNSNFANGEDNWNGIDGGIKEDGDLKYITIVGNFDVSQAIHTDEGQTYTISALVRKSTSADSKFRVKFDIDNVDTLEVAVNNSEWKRISTTRVATTTGSQLLFFHTRNTFPIDMTELQIEKGSVVTDWTPHPDELYAGITRINKDGVNVGISTSQTNTQISYDGLRVYDGTTERAYFGESGSFVPDLEVGNILGNVNNTIAGDMTLTVGSGYSYSTISQALASLGNRKNLNGYRLTINVMTAISDSVTIRGWQNGFILINLPTTPLCSVQISAINNTALIFFGYGKNKHTSMFPKIENSRVFVASMIIDGGGGYTLSDVLDGSMLVLRDCDLSGFTYGPHVYTGCELHVVNCKGSNIASSLFVLRDGGKGYLNGAIRPNCGMLNHEHDYFYNETGTLTPTNSAYSPPAVTPTVFTSTFKPTALSTYNRTEGFVSTYYGSTAAQGKYTGMSGWMEGRITFGPNVASYWQGGYNVSVRMRLHRKNSTHGTSAAVKPDPDNFLAGGLSTWPTAGAVRGDWSDWASVSSAEFSTSTNKEFRFYSPTLDTGYAIWDDAEVEVTVTKSV